MDIDRSPLMYLLSTSADRQGVDMSANVCLFVFVCVFVCTVVDFSGKDKASGVKFCMGRDTVIVTLQMHRS